MASLCVLPQDRRKMSPKTRKAVSHPNIWDSTTPEHAQDECVGFHDSATMRSAANRARVRVCVSGLCDGRPKVRAATPQTQSYGTRVSRPTELVSAGHQRRMSCVKRFYKWCQIRGWCPSISVIILHRELVWKLRFASHAGNDSEGILNDGAFALS